MTAIKYIDGKRVASPEYRSWQMMKNRCLNPRAQDYARYGGRGITVCERWLKFENFLADMGPRPEGMTLERDDTNGNYTPKNCVWATRLTQSRNRDYAKNKAWLLAEKLGVSRSTAQGMIGRVRAKDRGNLAYFDLSPEKERIVREHLRASAI